jgi:hypothetical protein
MFFYFGYIASIKGNEPCDDKTYIERLRPAWIETSLHVRDRDQPERSHSLIGIYAVCLQTTLQVDKLIAIIMDPDQTDQHKIVTYNLFSNMKAERCIIP